MSVFVWKRHYELGIEAIDTQHKMIMDRFNLLYEAITKGEDQKVVASLMVDILDFIRLHFHDEEAILDANRYPRAEAQRAAHRDFLKRAESHYRAYLATPIVNPLELAGLMQDWIENHMLTMDMDFKEFMVRLDMVHRFGAKS